jgi:BlaI family penicillinase repressor
MRKSAQFLTKPTDGELEILAVLWDKGATTVRDVCDCLNKSRKVGYTSVLKMLQIMYEKGLVKRREFGKAHLYESTACREAMQTQLLNELCRQAFSGSATQLAIHALSMTPTSESDLEEIRKMVTEHRRNR